MPSTGAQKRSLRIPRITSAFLLQYLAKSIFLLGILFNPGLITTAHAQTKNLDQTAFIEGLRREGMSELLLHLTQTEKMEPIQAKQIEVSCQLLRAQNQELPIEQRTAAIDSALTAQRALIKDNYDDPLRPMWQTDLAEMLLVEQFPVVAPLAAEFYEFGVPTVEQEKALESAAAEAYQALSDASSRFFRLPNILDARPDNQEKFVNTGLRERLFKEYAEKRTVYFQALSAYYLALLPDSHAYYQTLGKNPQVPAAIQKTTPAEERSRLLSEAIEKLEKFTTASSGKEAAARFPALSLTGRAYLAKRNHNKAAETINLVVAANKADLVDLLAKLAWARSADLQNKPTEFQNRLDAVAANPLVSNDPIFRLLVADLAYKSLNQRAITTPSDKRDAALSAAYKPYDDLIHDLRIKQEVRDQIRAILYARWLNRIDPRQSPDRLPAIVLVGLGETYRWEGQNLAIEASNAPDKAALLTKQAKLKLERSIVFNQTAIQRKDLSPSQRAQAMFNLGVAAYYTAPQDNANLAKVVSTWTDLAEKLPDQQIAEDAISQAMQIAHVLHTADPKPPGADELYQRAFKVLTTRFPRSHAADSEYAYYAFTILTPAGNYKEAIEAYEKVPQNHPNYFDARREILFCISKMVEGAQPPQKDRWLSTLADEAVKTREEAEAELAKRPPPKPEWIPTIRSAAAQARLVITDLAIRRNDPAAAVKTLVNFEKDFAADPELVRLGLQKRITALAACEKYKEANAAAQDMMAQFPDSAAPTINQVVSSLDAQADALRRQAVLAKTEQERSRLTGQATQIAKTVEGFAQMLNDWAVTQKLSRQEMVPYKLILAKSIRLAGRPTDALAILEPLLQENPQDADVLNNLAETYFVMSQPDKLQKALDLYLKLISGLPQSNPVFQQMWWNAWMRSLQLRDRLDNKTDTIPMLVSQLKLKSKELGGDPYKSEIERLERKYLERK